MNSVGVTMSEVQGDLLPVDQEDVIFAVQFVLSQSRPRSKNWSANAERHRLEDRILASKVVDHLKLANFKIFRGPPGRAPG